MVACDVTPEPPAPRASPLRVELDERSVLVGDVVGRLDADDYVYLRLAIVSDTAQADGSPRGTHAARPLRWVALEGDAPALGERVRVRSLARRSRVWEPALGRDFEHLDYVARLPEPAR
jgi:hypothetical protein